MHILKTGELRVKKSSRILVPRYNCPSLQNLQIKLVWMAKKICSSFNGVVLFCGQVGDTIDITGPAGKVIYLGRGYIRVKYPGKAEQIRFATDIGLIAGGTGVRYSRER